MDRTPVKYVPGQRVAYIGHDTRVLIGRTVEVVEHIYQNEVRVATEDGGRYTVKVTNLALEPQPVKPPLGLPEHTGKSVNYYKVQIDHPTTKGNPAYIAECNDIIEALGMNYAQGNAFKALWRQAAALKLGLLKQGNNALYDAEKVEFFGARLVEQFTVKAPDAV